ncbi:MAG: Cof-type HAD-IIB family hydrolase [Christensenellaceae bacterium]|jgi:Cof subfamily protein (haloacid dehalogenase superfamily)|nr:Cof-type HAD-IIB family hydrolase [Christensenellaceae bacterium]
MIKYKLVAADFDDTLALPDATVSEETLKAVKEYENRGGKFIIATGRMPTAIMKKAQNYGFKGEIICFQGAYIYDIESEKELFSATLDCSFAAEISHYLTERGIYHHVYEGHNAVTQAATVPEAHEYYRLTGCGCTETHEPLEKYILAQNKRVPKVLIVTDPSNVLPYIAELSGVFKGKVNVNTSKPWLVEIVDIGTSKAIAVDWVAARYGIKQEETACFGDSLNDLSMLQYAGLGVVMENGDPSIKKIIGNVCPPNTEDGVAQFIKRF